MKNRTLKNKLVAQFYHKNIPVLCVAVFGALVAGSLNLILSWILQQLIDTASGGLNALPLNILAWISGGFSYSSEYGIGRNTENVCIVSRITGCFGKRKRIFH